MLSSRYILLLARYVITRFYLIIMEEQKEGQHIYDKYIFICIDFSPKT